MKLIRPATLKQWRKWFCLWKKLGTYDESSVESGMHEFAVLLIS
ncbi:MAG: hypothetical protein WB729_24935 [Candidatus Sulfotelmatobacter sp.]